MKAILGTMALLTATAVSQTAHFPGFPWKERETDHFVIRTHDTSTDPARRYAEKTWEVVVEVLTGLKEDFENEAFGTPGGAKAGREGEFRFCLYLVGSGDDFHQLVMTEAKRTNWSAGQVQVVQQVGNFTDSDNRFLVICKSDPLQSGGGRESDRTPILVHSTGSQLMKGRARQGQLPFWMTAGMGYYAEHQVLDKCSVAYLDFDRHYQDDPDGPVKVRKGEVLTLGTDWTRTLRDLCKDGQRVSLEDTLAAEILTLSPKQSGYLFALTYFLVSTDERAQQYRDFLKAVRDGAEPNQDLLLETYGFDDAESFETAWYDWMMSRQFK